MNNIFASVIPFLIIILVVIIFIYILFNQSLQISYYNISNQLIPKEFNNYKIVQLSDLHYKKFGPYQSKLISKIQQLSPDLIVMTGDMIDRKQTNLSNTEALFKGASRIAPIIVVSGNHEIYSKDLENSMANLYNKYNITHLSNTSTTISKNKSTINIYGIDFIGSYVENNRIIDELLSSCLTLAPDNCFSILLNHRSDIFDNVSSYNYPLVLSGHAHGGIIRLPLIGGLISNQLSLFPKYDNGIYHKNNSTMIVSRGLGNSNYIPRLLNRPDLVTITLKSECTK